MINGKKKDSDNKKVNINEYIRAAEVRVISDDGDQLGKVPFMLVLGDKEVENGTVAVRRRGGEDLGPMSPTAFEALASRETAPPRWDA